MRVALVEVGHGGYKPSVYSVLQVVVADVRVVHRCQAEVRHHVALGIVIPVLRRHILHPRVVRPRVIENHIHHHLHPAPVSLVDKGGVLLVGAETRVNPVVIRCGIAVIASAGHVVLKHRAQPYRRHAQRIEIAQMLVNTLNITAMPSIGIVAVGPHREVHRRHSVLRTLACLCPFPSLAVDLPLRKPVRHKQIQHIAGIKARIFLASPIPFLQLIVKRPLFTVQDIPDLHNTRLNLRQYSKIQ